MKITLKETLVWFREQGFTNIKQNKNFGCYFKTDGITIRWYWDDSMCTYKLRWQIRHKKNKAEIGPFVFGIQDEYYTYCNRPPSFYNMMIYIKENNNEMIKELKTNIN